jgi:hypothetical protein
LLLRLSLPSFLKFIGSFDGGNIESEVLS